MHGQVAAVVLSLLALIAPVCKTAAPPLVSNVSYTVDKTDKTELQVVCQSPECLALSALITSNMNLTADPCQDFSAYACGNYHANTLHDPADLFWAREDEPMVMRSGFDSVRVKVSRRTFELLLFHKTASSADPEVDVMYNLTRCLFRSCLSWLSKRNRRGHESDQRTSEVFFNGVLTHLFDSIGWKRLNVSFERALAKMVRFGVWPLVEVGPAFSIMSDVNTRQSNGSARVRLDYSVWNVPTSNMTDYINYIKSLASASSLFLDSPEFFAKIVYDLRHKVSPIESKLGEDEIIQQWENCSDTEEFLESGKSQFTVGEMDILSSCTNTRNSFSWTDFFGGVLDGKVESSTLIEIGSVSELSNLINLVDYFKGQSFSTGHSNRFSAHFSFLVFDWLLSFWPYFPTSLAPQTSRISDRRRALPSLDGDEPVSDCAMLTRKLLGPVVERMFQAAYHAENFDHVRSLVELVQNATIQSVREQAWITPTSKDAIVDKISALKREIGFHVFTARQLKAFYASTIRAFKAGHYLSSHVNFGVLLSLAMCASAGKRNNLLSNDIPISILGSSDALVVNAFNYLRSNQIVFPMGILTPFLYHRSYPDYVNLGGIGFVIGHEIGHGFDDEGHETTKQGDRAHFWDSLTEAGYRERVQCTAARFGKYELAPGQLHNSAATIGNDISDLMGIRSAFGALQELLRQGERQQRPLARLPNLPDSLTPERLFFVQAVQAWCTKAEPGALVDKFLNSRHSPPHIRIRGMMENSRDFARVFQCQAGQAMNPREKCEFW